MRSRPHEPEVPIVCVVAACTKPSSSTAATAGSPASARASAADILAEYPCKADSYTSSTAPPWPRVSSAAFWGTSCALALRSRTMYWPGTGSEDCVTTPGSDSGGTVCATPIGAIMTVVATTITTTATIVAPGPIRFIAGGAS